MKQRSAGIVIYGRNNLLPSKRISIDSRKGQIYHLHHKPIIPIIKIGYRKMQDKRSYTKTDKYLRKKAYLNEETDLSR